MNKLQIMTPSVEIYPISANVAEVVWATRAAAGHSPIPERLFHIPAGASVCS